MNKIREVAAVLAFTTALSACANPVESGAAGDNTPSAEQIGATAAESVQDLIDSRRKQVLDVYQDFAGKYACSSTSIEVEIVPYLEENSQGDETVARVTEKIDNEPILELTENFIKYDSNDSFLAVITHEIVHACSAKMVNLEEALELPNGDKILGFDGFGIVYDSIKIDGEDSSKFNAVEQGLSEFIVLARIGKSLGDTKSYSEVLKVTKKVVEKTNYSAEDLMDMAARSDMLPLIAAFYDVDVNQLSASRLQEFLLMYQDAFSGKND